MKKERKIPPVAHVYAFAGVWLLWALFLPMHRLVHFIGLLAASVLISLLFRRFFPGKKVYVSVPEPEPEPFSTGDPEVDGLIREGELALSEMARLRQGIADPEVGAKVDRIIEISGRIVGNVMEDPAHFRGVQRFLRYYLPTTLKLLHAYDRMDAQGISGENISGTMGRIEDVLDTLIVAYKKQLDALFAGKAMDIETDIQVMEGFLKREGLADGDFDK